MCIWLGIFIRIERLDCLFLKVFRNLDKLVMLHSILRNFWEIWPSGWKENKDSNYENLV